MSKRKKSSSPPNQEPSDNNNFFAKIRKSLFEEELNLSKEREQREFIHSAEPQKGAMKLNDGSSPNPKEIISAGVMTALFVLIVWGGIHLCKIGYNHWFRPLVGTEIGQKGLIYVPSDYCIYKPNPHRKVFEHIDEVCCNYGDTIGFASFYGTWGLMNLNTAEFITATTYEAIFDIDDTTCFAILDNEKYIFHKPTGEILNVETDEFLYKSFHPIYIQKRDVAFEDEYYGLCEETDCYEYEDFHGNIGLMSKDFKVLTPAKYKWIHAVNMHTFFCGFNDAYTQDYGEIRNSKGELLTRYGDDE